MCINIIGPCLQQAAVYPLYSHKGPCRLTMVSVDTAGVLFMM